MIYFIHISKNTKRTSFAPMDEARQLS